MNTRNSLRSELPLNLAFFAAAATLLALVAASERELIARALERTGGNRTRSAELLDLSTRALSYKIQEYELE